MFYQINGLKRWLKVKKYKSICCKTNKKRKISFGLSSYGYDARVSDDFKIFTNVNSTIVDPKNFNQEKDLFQKNQNSV